MPNLNDQNENNIDDAEEATIGMSEIDAFDFGRAMVLMNVIEKVAGVAPKATSILGCAQAALEEMNEEAKSIARRRADEFARIEAERAQQLAEERAAHEAAEAEAAEAPEPESRPRAIPHQPNPADVGRRL